MLSNCDCGVPLVQLAKYWHSPLMKLEIDHYCNLSSSVYLTTHLNTGWNLVWQAMYHSSKLKILHFTQIWKRYIDRKKMVYLASVGRPLLQLASQFGTFNFEWNDEMLRGFFDDWWISLRLRILVIKDIWKFLSCCCVANYILIWIKRVCWWHSKEGIDMEQLNIDEQTQYTHLQADLHEVWQWQSWRNESGYGRIPCCCGHKPMYIW